MRDFLDNLIEPAQRSQEWVEQHIGKPTSSEIHKILTPVWDERPMTRAELDARPKTGKGSATNYVKVENLNELSSGGLTYVREKVAETLTGVIPTVSTPAIRWGEEYEEEAKQYYTARTGIEIVPAFFVDYKGISGGTPDGYIGKDTVVEAKCPYNSGNQIIYMSMKAQTFKEDFPEYYWQCQANMLFTKRKKCLFFSYDPRMPEGLKICQIQLLANPIDQQYMVKKIEVFDRKKREMLSYIEQALKPFKKAA